MAASVDAEKEWVCHQSQCLLSVSRQPHTLMHTQESGDQRISASSYVVSRQTLLPSCPSLFLCPSLTLHSSGYLQHSNNESQTRGRHELHVVCVWHGIDSHSHNNDTYSSDNTVRSDPHQDNCWYLGEHRHSRSLPNMTLADLSTVSATTTPP